MILTNEIKNRMLFRFGGNTVDVELNDEQINSCYDNATNEWELYSVLSQKEEVILQKIKSNWIEQYFQALCKETLGRIRGKYVDGFPVPGIENVKLDYESLLRESKSEKEELINLLLPSNDKIILAFYVGVGNLPNEEVAAQLKKAKELVGETRGFTKFFIATRDETKIECVYPKFVLDSEIAQEMNKKMLNLLKGLEEK